MGVVTFLSENINYKELRKYFPSLPCIVLCCQVPFLVVLASLFLAGGCGPGRSPQPGTPHGGPRARDLGCTSTPSLQRGLHAHPHLGRRPPGWAGLTLSCLVVGEVRALDVRTGRVGVRGSSQVSQGHCTTVLQTGCLENRDILSPSLEARSPRSGVNRAGSFCGCEGVCSGLCLCPP